MVSIDTLVKEWQALARRRAWSRATLAVAVGLLWRFSPVLDRRRSGCGRSVAGDDAISTRL